MKFDTATVLHVGDRVLLTLTDNGWISRDQIETTQAGLAARFPGVEFTFVNGVNAVHVLPVAGSQETTGVPEVGDTLPDGRVVVEADDDRFDDENADEPVSGIQESETAR